MKTNERILTYRWIIDTLRKSPHGLTRKELSDLWKEETDLSGGLGFAESTFKKHLDGCFDVFKVLIECDTKHGYKYYIANSEDLVRGRVQQYMLRSVAVGKVLSDSAAIYDRILLEPMPSDEFIELVILAMNRSKKIEIAYQEYGTPDEESILIEPYALKTYHHRWYVLGKLSDGTLKVYSLDRVNKVTQTKDSFVMDETFDATHYFSEYYAVRMDKDVKLEKVILRAHENERFILDRQPIHWSQKKVSDGDKCSDFELTIRPTFDFVTYLESQGRFIEVMEPMWLRKELLRVHREAMNVNKVDEN